MNNTNEKNRNKAINIGIIFVCVLIICIIVGFSFAWLTDIINNNGLGTIGEVKIEIYDGNTKINGYEMPDGTYETGIPYEVTLGAKNMATTLNLKIKNAGNIDGIVRCLVAVSTNEGPTDHQTDLVDSLFLVQDSQAVTLIPDWTKLYDSEFIEDIQFYNAFLNSVIEPNQTANVITSITPLGDLENTTIYIRLRADIVAYSGNAYQVDSAENPVPEKDKPFGNLTSEFLNIWTAWKPRP